MMVFQSISSFFTKFRGFDLKSLCFWFKHLCLSIAAHFNEERGELKAKIKLLLYRFSLKSSQNAFESLILMSSVNQMFIRKMSISLDRRIDYLFQF